MRAFRNLSVGRKLAAGVILANLLLCVLVVLVRLQFQSAQDAQAAERNASAGRAAARQAALNTSRAAVAMRDIALAQGAEPIAGHAATVAAELRLAEAELATSARLAASPEAQAQLQTAAGALRDYATAATEQAQLRTQLVALRDDALVARTGQYDQAFEAMASIVDIDVPEAIREEVRQRLMTFHGAVNDVRLGIQRYLGSGEDSQARRVRRASAQLRVHHRALAATRLPANGASDLKRVGDVAEALAEASLEALRLAEAAQKARVERADPARQRAEAALQAATGLLAELAGERGSASSAAARRVELSVVGIGAAVALVLMLSGWATARAISTPLRRLAGVVGTIATGQAGGAVPDQDRRDEIGRIAQALEALRTTVGRAFAQQQMLEQLPMALMTADPHDGFRLGNLNPQAMALMGQVAAALPCPPAEVAGQPLGTLHPALTAALPTLAEPDRLPHRLRFALGGEIVDLSITAIRDSGGGYVAAMLAWHLATAQARLADSFEAEVGSVVEAVAAAAGQVQGAAEALSGVAATSGREAATVAEVSAQAGADVQAVAASAEQLAASVAEISRQVAEGAAVAREAAAAARATDSTVQGLAQAANRIGDVIRLIGNIAGQTNLLALNATIEAARAGEAGKGFAVVASEVKALASQTARATEEIGQQVGAIQTTTEQAVAALRAIGGTIGKLNEVTTAIAAAVEQQGAATREIARSAAQVAEGTTAVTHRIGDVRQAAADTGEASAGLLGAANELSGQAGALRGRAGEFLAMVRKG